jgi:AcrR family transcriptional regulator
MNRYTANRIPLDKFKRRFKMGVVFAGDGTMAGHRSDGIETRQRLLAAAAETFAAKGFWKAGIAEICRRAGTNVASANYHFGGKEALYVEAWRHAFEMSSKKYPPDGGVPADAPAEERLRGRILSIMRRVSDPESYGFDIVHKEMASPTGLLKDAVGRTLEPIRAGFSGVIREILAKDADETRVQLCRMSIMAQCLHPLLRERRRVQSVCAAHATGTEHLLKDVERLAEHVTRFSLAGMRGTSRPAPAAGTRKSARPLKGTR